MRARELSEKLSENAEAVARELLPNGKVSSNEWCVGSIDGEEGKSLKVCISGIKVGIWQDFADATKKGDLLGLIMAVKNLSLPEAMQWGIKFLGISEAKPTQVKEQIFPIPEKPKTAKAIHAAPKAFKYMHEERKLSEEVLKKYKIAGDSQKIYFPFISSKGKLNMLKSLKIERVNGRKDMMLTSTPQKKTLFGWPNVAKGAREVVICEGEINAMSIHQMGYDALAVPFGGGGGKKQDWVINEFDNLERFDEIFIWCDQDKSGWDAVPELITRLGRERCRIIKSKKDANDVLCATGNIEKILKQSEEQAPSSFLRVREIEDRIWDELSNPDFHLNGYSLPWPCLSKDFRFRPSEVTILAGMNSHGKTAGVGQMIQHILASGGKACVASLEGPTERWISNILKQNFLGSVPATRQEMVATFEWYNNALFTYRSLKGATQKDIFEVFKYCRSRFGVKFFVIDNLTATDVGIEDYDAQRNFIIKLVEFATNENVHILLVAHMRKPSDDSKPGNKYDVKGSGSLTDLTDNVLIWWRNRAKEAALRDNNVAEIEKYKDDPDTALYCEKQRTTGNEFKKQLWFFPELGKTFWDKNGPANKENQPSEWDRFGEL